MMTFRNFSVACCRLLSGRPAKAEWVQANSSHFIVYSRFPERCAPSRRNWKNSTSRCGRRARWRIPSAARRSGSSFTGEGLGRGWPGGLIYRVQRVGRRLLQRHGQGPSPWGPINRLLARLWDERDVILFPEYAPIGNCRPERCRCPAGLPKGSRGFFNRQLQGGRRSPPRGARAPPRQTEGVGAYLPMRTMLAARPKGPDRNDYLLGWALTHI